MIPQKRFEVSDDGVNYSEFLKAVEKSIDPQTNTVLLVDDDRGIRRKIARDVIQFDPNIEIHEAGNGLEALKQLEVIRKKHQRDPRLIVLDLNMPLMSGWDLIEHLKKEYESKGLPFGIPIIVLSSTSGETGLFLLKKSVHDGKSGYQPLVTVAKETCTDSKRYDAVGERGLLAWLKHFTRRD